ncbi:glycoside hydrolase family 105 protein [Bacteroides sp. 51]|uniref:glycoside hydrolase family 88/105 protein n=1 Tax=Bacteroides sp. 51 TaxID=2302938 RepID=UPI0013D38F88|nr:glycoside hydrolase family 88 protein [Bacteroides sp. 51]NDV83467.1 glycoside hydrolase family 88 protein [Bacteroides sp. 51]
MKPHLKYLCSLILLTLSVGCVKGNLTDKNQVIHLLDKITAYQLENFTYLPAGEKGNHHDYGIDAWTNGVLYLGLSQWMEMSNHPDQIQDWLMKTGTESRWAIPANFAQYPKYQYYHADELCIGQFYLYMYDKYKSETMLTSVRERADWIMSNPPDTSMNYRNKQAWSWCDALFMAPPVYAHLSQITGDPKYLIYMHNNYLRAYTHLYDPENRLFFRDDSYFDKFEANGTKIFWGRGNGWVLAGIANILQLLPAHSEIRPFYETLFVELSSRLCELQSHDGFWHASLLDPDSYPSPETSSTALITYGLAYGVNNGLLDDSYLPVILKAWNALTSVVDENGKVGWVQPIGADPKKVTRDMTAVYGVGAFLMAGKEIIKLHQQDAGAK